MSGTDELKRQLNEYAGNIERREHLSDDQRATVRKVASWAQAAIGSTAIDSDLSPLQRENKAAEIAKQAEFEIWKTGLSDRDRRLIAATQLTEAEFFNFGHEKKRR